MKFTYKRAREAIERSGARLAIFRIKKQKRGRLLSPDGEVLGTLTVRVRELLLDNVHLRVAEKRANCTVFEYDAQYAAMLQQQSWDRFTQKFTQQLSPGDNDEQST